MTFSDLSVHHQQKVFVSTLEKRKILAPEMILLQVQILSNFLSSLTNFRANEL
jgi:hypothetical protein